MGQNSKQNKARTLPSESAETTPTTKPRRSRKWSPERWEKERAKLAEELGKVWPEGVSAVEAVAEIRR